MSHEEREDTTSYAAVVNDEEQYSIWPADRELPLEWSNAGKEGPKAEVLAWIEEVWTEMHPLSLRRKMEEAGIGAALALRWIAVGEPGAFALRFFLLGERPWTRLLIGHPQHHRR